MNGRCRKDGVGGIVSVVSIFAWEETVGPVMARTVRARQLDPPESLQEGYELAE